MCRYPLCVAILYVSLSPICRYPQCVAVLYMSLSLICRYHLYVAIPYMSLSPMCRYPQCVAILYVSLSPMCRYPLCVAILSLSRHLSLVCLFLLYTLSLSRLCICRVSVCLSPWRFLALRPLSISLSFASTFSIFSMGSPSVLPPCLLFRLLSLLSVTLSAPCSCYTDASRIRVCHPTRLMHTQDRPDRLI